MWVALLGLVICGGLFYKIYGIINNDNTKFESDTVTIFIPTGSDLSDVERILNPYLKSMEDFHALAPRKKYDASVKAGKYILKRGMTNNQIIGVLRNGNGNTPVKVLSTTNQL